MSKLEIFCFALFVAAVDAATYAGAAHAGWTFVERCQAIQLANMCIVLVCLVVVLVCMVKISRISR